jgi:hypothetical protein
MFPETLAGDGGGNRPDRGPDVAGRFRFGIKGLELAWAAVAKNKNHTVAGLGCITFGAQASDGKTLGTRQHPGGGDTQETTARTRGADPKHKVHPGERLWGIGKRQVLSVYHRVDQVKRPGRASMETVSPGMRSASLAHSALFYLTRSS